MSAGTSVGDVKTSPCIQCHVPQVPQLILLSNAKVNVNTEFNNHSNSNTSINTKISPVTVSGIFSKPSRVVDLGQVEKENDNTGAIAKTNHIDKVITSQVYPIPLPLLRPFRNRYASTCTNTTSTTNTSSSSSTISIITQRILDGISATSFSTFIIPTADIDFETISEREMVTIKSHGYSKNGGKPYGYDHAEGILRIAKRIMGNENFMELITTTDTLTIRLKRQEQSHRSKPYAFVPYEEEDVNNDGITDVNQFVEDVIDFGTSAATKDSELQFQHQFRFQLPQEVDLGVDVQEDTDTWNTNGTVVRRSAVQNQMRSSIPCSGDITNTTITMDVTMTMTPVPVPEHKHWIMHWHCWVAWWTDTHQQRPRRHHHHRHRHHRIGTDTDAGIGPSQTAPHV
jgi:hypothetical protein